ncbi:uncharacterized protein LOC132700151 [Cylas formicarius]|uniref:uncharacterized protein LOC132700151 n=1 Tax=Cylas formicarius TaxID=197179 RepID=UPI0029585CA9|nr:uncharacterized protein LOC132700151 [Cylas formicarius]
MTLPRLLFCAVLLVFSALFCAFYGASNVATPPPPVFNRRGLKKLIAFSLRKQIEGDGPEYACERRRAAAAAEILAARAAGHWTRVENTEAYVRTVGLDERLRPYRYLRFVGAVKGSANEAIYCQIYYGRGSFRTVKATITPVWYGEWDASHNDTSYYNPTLISCRLPISTSTPTSVSLSTSPCDEATSRLEIPVASRRAVDFTVCVKPLNFDQDVSDRLVRWIEICRIFGAQRFHIYVGNVTDETRATLKWYKASYPGLLRLENFRPISETGRSVWQRRRYEVVAYNGCFYKNLDSKFVVPLDVNEVIVPKLDTTWSQLVQSLPRWSEYASLVIRNVYFFGGFGDAFIFGRNMKSRVRTKAGDHVKSFISTENALTVFNHYALSVLVPSARSRYLVPIARAQLNHYKDDCDATILPECSVYLASPRVPDTSIFRFKKVFDVKYRERSEALRGYLEGRV